MQKLPEKSLSEFSVSFDKYLNDPEFQKLVSEYTNHYVSWDEIQNRIEDPEQQKKIWTFIKILRQMQYEHITFRNLDLKYSFIPEIFRHLHRIDHCLSGSFQTHKKAIRTEQSIMINTIMEEAVSSSILAGAEITFTAAKEILRDGRKTKTRAEQIVINNYEALQFMLVKKDTPLTKELILDLQRIVTRDTVQDTYVGNFRADNEIVASDLSTGLVYHTPSDFREIGSFIDDFCGFVNENKKTGKEAAVPFIHPVIKGIVLLYLMEYYHPFNDGNSRTARTIFYWFMLSQGYWIFDYLPVSRIILKSQENYKRTYLTTVSDENDLTYFLKYTISCIVEALDDFQKSLEQKQTEQNATKAIIKNIDGVNQRQADILREMMEHSGEYFSIRKIMLMYSVVYQTARTDLLDLEQRGFLTRQKKGREFLFTF